MIVMWKHYPKGRLCSGMLTALLLCVLMPAVSYGHSLFIQSSRYRVDSGRQSPLFFCYGHHVPVDDGLRAKKLRSVRIYTPAGDVREIAIRNETCLHSYMVDYDLPGTYVLAAETNPGYYTVYVDKKGREHHVIKPKSDIIDKAKEVKMSLYSKQYTKTYVVCEEPSATFPAHIGLSLELVPTQDISGLKPGQDLVLKVYFKGRPFTGQGTWDATYNGFSTEMEDNFYPRETVSGDIIRMPVPHSGRWFVRYSFETDAIGKDTELYNHLKYTATIVFEVPNARKTVRLQHH